MTKKYTKEEISLILSESFKEVVERNDKNIEEALEKDSEMDEKEKANFNILQKMSSLMNYVELIAIIKKNLK